MRSCSCSLNRQMHKAKQSYGSQPFGAAKLKRACDKPALSSLSSNRACSLSVATGSGVPTGITPQPSAKSKGKRQRKGEINFAVPILQGRLPAAHGKKASAPNKANIFSCSFSTLLPKTPDENPLKNCLYRYRTKSANRAMFATDKAVSWFNLSRFSQNSHHFNGFPRLFFIFRRPLYAEAV